MKGIDLKTFFLSGTVHHSMPSNGQDLFLPLSKLTQKKVMSAPLSA